MGALAAQIQCIGMTTVVELPAREVVMSSRLIPAALFFAIFIFGPRAANAAGPTTLPATPSAARPTTQRVRALVGALSGDDWKERQKARDELGAMGPLAEAELRARLKDKPDPETMMAIEALLQQIAEGARIAPTLITLQLRSVTPKEAAVAIAREGHIEFAAATDALLADAAGPIDLDLDRTPMWQAVLDLCSKSHLALSEVDQGGHMVLMPIVKEVPPPPLATAGPFLVAISRIEVTVTRAADFAGRKPINIRNNANAAPACRLYMFPFCESRLKAIHWFIDSVDECVTDTGQTVQLQGGFRGFGGGRIGPWMNETQLTFKAPPQGKTIVRLKMTARFVLQQETQKLEVPDILAIKNSTHLLAGFRLVIAGVHKVGDGRYAYDLSIFRDAHSQAEWSLMQSLIDNHGCHLVDADGKILGGVGGGSSYGNDKLSLNYTFNCDIGNGNKTGEPAKLVWEIPSKTQQVIVPLEFRDIELPR
jgi:hypothetical protein